MIASLLVFLSVAGQAAKPEDEAPADIFASQSDAIVVVVGLGKSKRSSRLGSGFIVSEDGQIVTNYHIIEKAKKIFVKLKNKKVYNRVRVISFDRRKDIAVLKIDARRLKKVVLGNSHNVKIGQRVITIGNPLGLENTVADGLISSLRKDETGQAMLQISVPLSSGSSGGPLFNLEGEVIGITTASMANGQNLNFAIPINELGPLLKEAELTGAQDTSLGGATEKFFLHPDRRTLGLETQNSFHIYRVKPNDTLYSLSRRFAVSVREIMLMNQLSDTFIFSGQRIKIPTAEFYKRKVE